MEQLLTIGRTLTFQFTGQQTDMASCSELTALIPALTLSILILPPPSTKPLPQIQVPDKVSSNPCLGQTIVSRLWIQAS